MLLKSYLMFVLLTFAQLGAEIKGTNGAINFLPNSQNTSAQLTTTGLGIGITPSANLHVAGNAIITTSLSVGGLNLSSSNLHVNGSFALSCSTISQTTIYAGPSTLNFLDSGSGDFIFYLPNPNTIEGRILTLKKIVTTNNIVIRCIDPTYKIDGKFAVALTSGNQSSINLISGGGNYFIAEAQSVDYHLLPAPTLLKAEASDLTGGNTILNNGDRILLAFSEATNQMSAGTKSQIDNLVDFKGSILGTDYTGSWSSADRLLLTVVDFTGGNLTIGANIGIKSLANLTNVIGDSYACSNSANVSGSWGGNIFVGSNLILWLDADDESTFTKNGSQLVSQWRDKSGYGSHANAAAGKEPTWVTAGEQSRGMVSFTTSITMTFPRSTAVRTVFWAMQETDHSVLVNNPPILGDNVLYNFNRGLDRDLLNPTTGTANTVNGNIHVNGEQVTATWQWLNSDTTVISLVTTGATAASQIFQDRTLTDRWFKGNLGEILIYDAPLSSAQVTEIDTYLINKWRGTSPPKMMSATAYDSDASAAGLSNGDQISVLFNTSTTQRSVATKADIDTIFDFAGKSLGTLYTGAWNSGDNLVITVYDATSGNLAVGDNLAIKASANILSIGGLIPCSDTTILQGSWTSGNSGDFTPSQISNLRLWADASNAASITSSSTNVILWRDLSYNHADLTGVSSKYPVLAGNTLNGKAVISFNNQYAVFPHVYNIRTVFWVLKESTYALSGAPLLGNTESGTYHFNRQNCGGNLLSASAHVDAKNGIWRINGGAPITPTTSGLTLNTWQLLSFVSAGATTALHADNFSSDRPPFIANTTFFGELAELIIYDKLLSDAERTKVENYLKAKWGL